MFNVERSVGRLIEVTMRSPVTVEEVEEAGRLMGRALAPLTGRQGIICGDYTQAKVLTPEASDTLSRIFREYNDRIERSGLLIASTSAMQILQMERVIREAANPARRVFRDPMELILWLGEILDPAERDRAHSFYITHGLSPSFRRRPASPLSQ